MLYPRFKICIDADSKYYFQFYNVNNDLILTGEKYNFKRECIRAVELVRLLSATDNFYQRIYGLSTNRFILKNENGEVIGHSGQFASINLKESAIKSLKVIIQSAPVIDVSM